MASYIGMTIYIGGLIFGSQQWRPPIMLVAQIVVLTTVQALVMVTGAVVVSSQTTSIRAANLLASFIIIPVSILVMAESVIMVQPHMRFLLWYIVIGLLVTVVLLVRMGTRIFNREELLGRALDHLSLRWAFRVFWSQFRGPAESKLTLKNWYRLSVFPAVRHLRTAMIVTGICLAAAFIGGWITASEWTLPLDDFEANDETLLQNLQSWFELGQDNPQLVMMAIGQNTRVLLLATILAIFSFGVIAIVLVMIPFALLGFILAQITAAGLSPVPFILAVIPHGVVEIPAIILAGAAALRLGSVVTHPPEEMTVGEAWLRALADTIKIGVGVVFPMLVIAGLLEVTLTPRIVEFVLSH
jgi:uncharacterized membrane protein SpoIIM required for sporulation